MENWVKMTVKNTRIKHLIEINTVKKEISWDFTGLFPVGVIGWGNQM
jgi:hypothetical protein